MTTRNFVFTSYMNDAPTIDETMKYLFFQLERGNEKGKLHWQGLVVMKQACRYTKVAKIIGKDCHVENMEGTIEQSVTYCSKSDTKIDGPWEYGEKPKGRGHRSDLDSLCEDLKGGMSIKEVACNYPASFIRNYRGIDKFKSLIDKKRDFMTELYIIWGASGSGKTRSVVEKEKDLYIHTGGSWWDGYSGQEAVLIDDVKWEEMGDVMKHTEFLRMIDRYPYQVPIKGGFVNFVTKRVYVTSMYDPVDWLLKDGIKRRCHDVTKLDG